jgi:uncharacterized protein (DUF736 family)
MGEINTLRLSGVHIVPEPKGTNENAPSHRICCGRIEVGAGWSKRSDAGRDYLSVKLDDPSLNAPIFANLFKDEGGETYSITPRPSQRRLSIACDTARPEPSGRDLPHCQMHPSLLFSLLRLPSIPPRSVRIEDERFSRLYSPREAFFTRIRTDARRRDHLFV